LLISLRISLPLFGLAFVYTPSFRFISPRIKGITEILNKERKVVDAREAGCTKMKVSQAEDKLHLSSCWQTCQSPEVLEDGIRH
jgi:hypothetical protein